MDASKYEEQRMYRILQEGERRRKRRQSFIEIIALIEEHRRANYLGFRCYFEHLNAVHELMKSRDGWQARQSNLALQKRQPLNLEVLRYEDSAIEPPPASERPGEAPTEVQTPEIIRKVDKFLEACPLALDANKRSLVAEFIYSIVEEDEQSNDPKTRNDAGDVAPAQVEEARAGAAPSRPKVSESPERMRYGLQYRMAQARLRHFGRVRNEIEDSVEPNIEIQEITKLTAAPRRHCRIRDEIKENPGANVESERIKQKNKPNIESEKVKQKNKPNVESERIKQKSKPNIESERIKQKIKPDIEIIKEIKQNDKPDIEIIKEIPHVSLNHTT